jgi:predicted phosphodiesterase
VVNRFAALDNLKEDNSVPQCQNLKMKPTVKKLTTKVHSTKKKVMIIGDSHVRGCAANLIHECGKSFEVMGIVMPGSGLLNITQAAKKEISELNRNDYIVIWGGSNDISKNESSKALKHATKFALQHRHTNIVFVPALHRYDLVESSCQQGHSCF